MVERKQGKLIKCGSNNHKSRDPKLAHSKSRNSISESQIKEDIILPLVKARDASTELLGSKIRTHNPYNGMYANTMNSERPAVSFDFPSSYLRSQDIQNTGMGILSFCRDK